VWVLVVGGWLLAACGGPAEEPHGAAAPPSADEPVAADLSRDALMQAAFQGALGTVQRAAEEGMDLDAADGMGRTPLMMAAYALG